jgi:hypothetical protein
MLALESLLSVQVVNSALVPLLGVALRKGLAMSGATRAPIPKAKCSACMYGADLVPHKRSSCTLPPVSRKPIAIPPETIHNASVTTSVQKGTAKIPVNQSF